MFKSKPRICEFVAAVCLMVMAVAIADQFYSEPPGNCNIEVYETRIIERERQDEERQENIRASLAIALSIAVN